MLGTIGECAGLVGLARCLMYSRRTIVLPTELAAAAILASFYVPQGPNYLSNVK
jgi:hypothetical protein